MTNPKFALAGGVILVMAWFWPLPCASVPPFSAHMTMHMAVVAVASPLLVLGVRGGRWDPVTFAPRWFSAIPASVVELVLVWGWHAPALHHAARHELWALGLEQATFLSSGLLLWVAALGGSPAQRRLRAPAGVTALLLTSMHMTLLGALIALTPRVLYAHPHAGGLSPLVDQQLGGAIMLLLGGSAYLAGGLGLTAELLLRRGDEGRA